MPGICCSHWLTVGALIPRYSAIWYLPYLYQLLLQCWRDFFFNCSTCCRCQSACGSVSGNCTPLYITPDQHILSNFSSTGFYLYPCESLSLTRQFFIRLIYHITIWICLVQTIRMAFLMLGKVQKKLVVQKTNEKIEYLLVKTEAALKVVYQTLYKCFCPRCLVSSCRSFLSHSWPKGWPHAH